MSDDLKVDWGKPIEAVTHHGLVAKVIPYAMPSAPRMRFAGAINGRSWGFEDNGLPLSANCPWRIRNVAEAPRNPEALSDPIAKRVEALVRAIAADSSSSVVVDHQDEARAIVALLPEPVDADLVEARSIIADAFRDYSGDEGDDSARMVEEGKMDDAGSVKRIVDYARRLRALERDSREG